MHYLGENMHNILFFCIKAKKTGYCLVKDSLDASIAI